MSHLDEFEMLVLKGARAGMAPGAGHQKEIYSSLEVAALKGRVPSLPEDELPSLEVERISLVTQGTALSLASLGSSGALLKLSALAALLGGAIVGGVLGFYGGYLTFGSGQSTASDARPAPPLVLERPPAAPTSPKLPPSDTSREEQAIEASVAIDEKEEASKQTPHAAKKKKSATPQRLKFHEEMSHLRRAQSALKRGDAALAWGLMRSLDEIHPKGALLPERHMTKVLALCALGRTPDAQGEAKFLLNSESNSVYLARLKTTCALPLENNE